jgi:histidine triad (HIT) family protein
MAEIKEGAKSSDDCIFCNIISGSIPSHKVYEDDHCIGILDINPANSGHVLVLPKEHFQILPLMPPEELKGLFIAARKVSLTLLRSLKYEGSNIFVANGASAGQKAPHVMVHVIPRKSGDGLKVFDLPANKIAPDQQDRVHKLVVAKVKERFG